MKNKLISILLVTTVVVIVFLYFVNDDKSTTPYITFYSHKAAHEKTNNQKLHSEDSTAVTLPAPKLGTKSDIETKTSVVKQCDAKLFTIDDPELEEKFSDTDKILETLQNNANVNSQLAFSILDFNKSSIQKEESMKLLERILEQDQANKLAQFLYFSKCSLAPKLSKCSINSSNEITLDSDNGALWLQIANVEAAKANLEGFTTALENTISAPTFNEYWAETIQLFDQAFLENGYNHKTSRMINAVGFSSALASGISELTMYCKKLASKRADIAQLCADAGGIIKSQAKTSFLELTGYSLQITALEALGEVDQAISLRKEKREIYPLSEHQIAVSNLLLFDEELIDYWFEKLKIHGEKKANLLLIDEAIRLSSNPNYNPCPE